MNYNAPKYPRLTEFGKEMFRKYPMTEYTNELRIDDEVAALYAYVSIMREYANDLATGIENMGKFTEELLKEFLALKKWVEEEGLQEKVVEVLNEWFENGKLANIINNEVFNMKANQEELNKTNLHLVKTENDLMSRAISLTNPPIPFVAAKGDKITDDTNIIQTIFDYAKQHKLSVFIPEGIFRTTDTLFLPDAVNLIGADKIESKILCDHNKPVIHLALNKVSNNFNPHQTGAGLYTNFSIEREERQYTHIQDNVGFLLHATYGNTIFRNLRFHNLGSSSIRMDSFSTYGTGPTKFEDIHSTRNNGFAIELLGLFANIYIDGVHGYADRGGISLDARRKHLQAVSPNQNIVIQNLDSEHCGGDFDQPRESLFVRGVHGVLVTGSTLQTNSGNNKVNTIDVEGSRYFTLGSGNEVTSRTGGFGLHAIDCPNVEIDNVSFSAANTGSGIKISDSPRAKINSPLFNSIGQVDVDLTSFSETRPIYILNSQVFGYITNTYKGVFENINQTHISSPYLKNNVDQTTKGNLTIEKNSPTMSYKNTTSGQQSNVRQLTEGNFHRLNVLDENNNVLWSPFMVDFAAKRIKINTGSGLSREIQVSGNCTSTTRPTGVTAGFTIYDTSVQKLIVWSGAEWRDAMGNVV